MSTVHRPAKEILPYGAVEWDTTVKKFNGPSIKFDGSDSHLTVASHQDFYFQLDDFTLEFWILRSSNDRTEMFMDFRTMKNMLTPFIYVSNTDLYYFVNGIAKVAAIEALPLSNTWYHVAVSRVARTTRMFVNGQRVGPEASDPTKYYQGPLTIGGNAISSQSVFGYMDDIMVTLNVGKYMENFPIPSTYQPQTPYTVFSLHSTPDIQNGSRAFADDNVLD